MDKLILFDIDGTLLKKIKGHTEAFTYGFKEVYDVEADIHILNFYGMTDKQIIIETLKKHGLSEEEILPKVEQCARVMEKFYSEEDDKIAVLAPGVVQLLEKLSGNGTLLGLVTGNLEPIAHSKLKIAGLDHYFKIGGFGTDDMNRANLVKVAIKKAQEQFGFSFDHNVTHIGDTPEDVLAAKSAGVRAVAVATGIYSKEELEKTGADIVFENLEDTEKVLGLLI